jgi:hypothetical protein
MPPNAAAYKRYLQKFDDQETQIERLQADVKRLQQEEHNQRKGYTVAGGEPVSGKNKWN